jgi:3-deoxy-manno-octulosonate cytidylyltransferase (CMP-KDO synthetase)
VYRVVIPARFGSVRLPGKPLLPLAGKAMIQWVYENARRSGASQVVVATDDERIAQLVRALGGHACLTAATHASGTDRIAEVARREQWHESEIVVNVQADEPLMPEALIDQVALLLVEHAGADLATLSVPLESVDALLNPNVVKVVTDLRQRALYFSRAPIPWSRDGALEGAAGQSAYSAAQRHLGIYAYRVAALLRMAALPPSRLEQIEKLEQLRALEHGMHIQLASAAVAPGPDVNTAADLAAVAALLEARRAS